MARAVIAMSAGLLFATGTWAEPGSAVLTPSLQIEEELEGEVRVSLVHLLLAPPQIRHPLDPELQVLLQTILEPAPDPEPEPEPVSQVVIESGRIKLRPDFEEGQSDCMDRLYETLRVTGCTVIDAPVYWGSTRVHRLTCLTGWNRETTDYLWRNVFFYVIHGGELQQPIAEKMDRHGWGELCVDGISRVHGVLPRPIDSEAP